MDHHPAGRPLDRFGELSTFQLILFISMGDLVQQAVTQQDSSVAGGIIAVVRPADDRAVLRERPVAARALGHPRVAVVVVSDGEPQLEVLRSERMSIDDLMALARQQGYERFSQIRLAVLEANGQLSFFGQSAVRSRGRRRPPPRADLAAHPPGLPVSSAPGPGTSRS